MKPFRAVRRAIKRAVASPWGWRTVGALLRRPGVIVLMYHRILGRDRGLAGLPIEAFAMQMRWLRENCEPITLDALADRVAHPNRVRPAVLVTFDDGYRDYHDLAYPVLKDFAIPATVFLTTSFVDDGGTLWTDDVQWAALSTTRSRVTLPWSAASSVPLPDHAARDALGAEARAYLKTVPDEERRDLLPRLFAALGNPPARERQMLNWDEVRRTMDITSYGGHSHTHPILSRLSSEVADREIRLCRERIGAETGNAPTAFAYPNGRPADYTAETKALLRRNGFTVAFSTSEGIVGRDTDWMAVKRLPGDGLQAHEFAWFASGLGR